MSCVTADVLALLQLCGSGCFGVDGQCGSRCIDIAACVWLKMPLSCCSCVAAAFFVGAKSTAG